ncbi:hypothetical protein M427DRAFT_144399, partial [Gonapodya prolifera JEL478]
MARLGLMPTMAALILIFGVSPSAAQTSIANTLQGQISVFANNWGTETTGGFALVAGIIVNVFGYTHTCVGLFTTGLFWGAILTNAIAVPLTTETFAIGSLNRQASIFTLVVVFGLICGIALAMLWKFKNTGIGFLGSFAS